MTSLKPDKIKFSLMKSMDYFPEHAEALNNRNGDTCFDRENFPSSQKQFE